MFEKFASSHQLVAKSGEGIVANSRYSIQKLVLFSCIFCLFMFFVMFLLLFLLLLLLFLGSFLLQF